MPEMNGLEIILELPRAFLDVKVIALSERSVAVLIKNLEGRWRGSDLVL